MLIGELSRKTGFSHDTIRFYQKRKLIAVNAKERRANNYIEYQEETLRKLLFIKKAKSFGFTLNEIAEFIQMIEMDEASCFNTAEIVSNKISVIDEKIRELTSFKEKIIGELKNNRCSKKDDSDCNVIFSNFNFG